MLNSGDLNNYEDVKFAFTGDTLFLGDVGRPDLAANSNINLTKYDLASFMFDSIQRLRELPDSVIVFPGHGAGSACGKNISNANSCTMGNQKQTNYAFQIEDREYFVKCLTENIPSPADYFFYNVRLNKDESKLSVQEILNLGDKKFSIDEFDDLIDEGDVIVLDCRSAQEFEEGHVPGSFFAPFKGQLAIFAANILGESTKNIVLVCSPGEGTESIKRLSRTGVEGIIGYFEDFSSYRKGGYQMEKVESISADDLFQESLIRTSEIDLVDVRGLSEFQNAHIPNSQLFSLDVLRSNYHQLDPKKELMIYCQGGLRSVIAYSFLKNLGFTNIRNVTGGFLALSAKGFQIIKK
jgi:rhodanese-related sulfurtransferase